MTVELYILNHYVLLQFWHLHSDVHATPELKHSQYFFRHSVFLQMHPPFFRRELVLKMPGSL